MRATRPERAGAAASEGACRGVRRGEAPRVSMKIFGIDPGSARTGYGCVERTGNRHHLVALRLSRRAPSATFPERLQHIHAGLTALLADCRPDCVAVETIFHARERAERTEAGARHAESRCWPPRKRVCACTNTRQPRSSAQSSAYGRAEKPQIQQMVKLLLGLEAAPSPHDIADALAVAICHLHNSTGPTAEAIRRHKPARGVARSWREFRPS